MRISDWSSEVCSSDLRAGEGPARDEGRAAPAGAPHELEIVRQSAVGISDAAAKREPFGGAQDRFEFQTLDIEPASIHIDVEPEAELGRDLRVLPPALIGCDINRERAVTPLGLRDR